MKWGRAETVRGDQRSIVRMLFVKLDRITCLFVMIAVAIVSGNGGCSLIPNARTRDSLHNPFPQIKKVAVLPFFNQSEQPNLDGDAVARAYYAALQAVPGFEVLPVGVTAVQWRGYSEQFGEPRTGEDFQKLAQIMGVEAIVVGSVTDFDAYYPPRMAMTVHWYAAGEGFHPVPAGYGLPWGTKGENKIPARIVREAEFELARSQLQSQTPQSDMNPLRQVQYEEEFVAGDPSNPTQFDVAAFASSPLPSDWPDPSDLIPDPPSPIPPVMIRQHEPILTHTRLYRGDDPYFTARLADYVETGDDARQTSWQGYIKRSDDFIRFCCHLHISEMLEARGGRDQPDLILRWPVSRY